ncbi:MAG TPA: YciI family protein [Dehalococcoidia bacterium]|nr:YciI family protein [Dehalococcoidia bacterium]
MRIVGLLRADESSEAGEVGDRDLFERMGRLMDEIVKAGVLLATDGLKPSSEGKRVKYENGKVAVIDGPFTESKELVASYAVFQVGDWDEAIYWTTRFLEVLGEGEVELRPIFEPSDFPPELFPPEEAAREEALRAEMQRNASPS